MEVPPSILRGCQVKTSDHFENNAIKRQFWTKVVVIDDCISVKAEGSPNVSGLFKGKSEDTHSINKYDCNLADLPVIILQQVKVIRKRRIAFMSLIYIILQILHIFMHAYYLN